MTEQGQPPFDFIAIVGLGLIGGSVALAVRERWPSVRIAAVDRPAVLAHASGSIAIDRAATVLADVGVPDLLVLAAPVRQNVQLLSESTAHLTSATVITDVGGTKREIVQAARTRPAGGAPFIGGHPVGGSERADFSFARPDLFQGRPWVFTPDGTSWTDALERLEQLVRGLGARPTRMDAEAHDRMMALVSHLPQLAASALMEVVGRAAGAEGLELAGRGLTDSTRLASSPATVWRDVCASNADVVGQALDRLIACLSELRADLEQGDTLQRVFDEAARWRAELLKTQR